MNLLLEFGVLVYLANPLKVLEALMNLLFSNGEIVTHLCCFRSQIPTSFSVDHICTKLQ